MFSINEIEIFIFRFVHLANIARAVSRSYCGSEISETDIYSPYSFYGSEAGTDVAASDLHDGWNASQVINKNNKKKHLKFVLDH